MLLRAEGRTFSEIGFILNRSESRIARDHKEGLKLWAEERDEAIDAQKARADLSLEVVAREAWKSFRKSQQHMVEAKDEDGEPILDDKGNVTFKAIDEVYPGDPKWLAVIISAEKDRRAVYGVEAPTKTEALHSGTVNVAHSAVELTADELKQVAAGEFERDGSGNLIVGDKVVSFASISRELSA